MKKIVLLCAACLFGTLTACGGNGGETGGKTLEPSEYTDADFDTSGGVVVETEYEVYGSDAPWVSYTITNNTSDELAYGVAYAIEVLQEGQWYQVPFPDSTAWIDIGIILKQNDTNAHDFKFSSLNYRMADGQYRLIKDIGGKRYFDEFEVGKSPITAETPFGIEALEKLPKAYAADAAEQNGDVIVSHTGIINAEKLTDFTHKAALGLPAMVRIIQYTIEGDPVVTDIIYNENHRGYYLCRYDNSRDEFGGNVSITETIYSYLITDGKGLYLSNCASWEATDTYMDVARIQLVSDSTFEKAVTAAEEMTAERLAWNITRYRVFSPDTRQNVSLYGGLSYGYEGLTSSETREVKDPDGIATEIIDVLWPNDNTYVLICETTGSLTYFHANGGVESGYGNGFTMTDGRFEITS